MTAPADAILDALPLALAAFAPDGALLACNAPMAALLGDGLWDALSWLGLGVPAVLGMRGLLRRR